MKRVLIFCLVLMIMAMPMGASAASYSCNTQKNKCNISRGRCTVHGGRCKVHGANCSGRYANCKPCGSAPSNPTTPSNPAQPTEPSSPATPVGTGMSAMAAEVVAQVNQDRARYGLSPLSVDSDLTAGACIRAREIVTNFSHTRPDGSRGMSVSSKASGENIAKGQQTASKVMAAWMSSSGHRANILSSSYRTIGVCAYQVNGVMYWVQLFGR